MQQKVERILLVAITRLGDMLQASPVIMGLKRQFPEATLTVAIEKGFASVCEGIPGIDEIYPIDLTLICQSLHRERDGIVDAFQYVDEVVRDLREKSFDFCLNMSSSGYTALLLRMLDIPEMRGWVSDEEGHRMILDPWAMLFSAFVYHSNRDFNSMNLVDIFRSSAGVTMHPKSLQYEVKEDAREFADRFIQEHGLVGSGPVITIQAGASQEKRQWSPPRFAHLSRLLIERLNARLIFTGSSSEQRIIDSIFSVYSHPQMVSAAGKTTLQELGSLLQRSQVLITGDTGTMHLAVAVGTPVVANFLASALCFETGPYSEGNLVVQPQIACNPCNPNLPCSQYDCHDQVPPELLFQLTKLRLECSTEELLKLKLSSEVANPASAAVFVTTFDEDNFLLFHQLNGSATRNGFPAHFYDGAKAAYRALWKSEFDGTPIREWGEASRYLDPAPEIAEGIAELLALTEQGALVIRRLESLILDQTAPASHLREVNDRISALDKEIEHVGLSFGVLGAIVRMFIMEKENLRGDNALTLASQVNRLYDTLRRRTERFSRLYTYHAEKIRRLGEQSAVGGLESSADRMSSPNRVEGASFRM